MTVKLTRLNVKTTGIRKLLSLPGVQEDLGARGLRVADAVEANGQKVEGRPGKIDLPVTVTIASDNKRARVKVIIDHPSGQAVEAKHGYLAAAIDAGGDV
jgi:ribosomal protein L11